MTALVRSAFTELKARDRVRAVLDTGTFREILDPFAGVESPHLAPQGIVPQSDDGAVIGRGSIDGVSAVVVALDGGFQGGGVGEISGAKIAASLEQAINDNRNGTPTRAVVLLETGGIRLQEANLGLLAIADIHAALVELRSYGPVVGIVAGMVGCFGGMGIAAGLTSHLIVTRGGRLGLNGPEVIETEAGVAELDSSDRSLIWSMIGGEQRAAIGQAEILVEDDHDEIGTAVREIFAAASADTPHYPARAEQITENQALLAAIDPTSRPTPHDIRTVLTGGSL